MLGTGAEKGHGLKCLTVYVTWWGLLFNVQLFQIDPVDCVWSYQLTFLSDQSQNEMYIFGYNIPLILHKELFF